MIEEDWASVVGSVLDDHLVPGLDPGNGLVVEPEVVP